MDVAKEKTRARRILCQMMELAEELKREMPMKGNVVIGRGFVLLPDEGKVRVHLTPVEMALYRLVLAHPEGIAADNLLLHWKELCALYREENWFDEPAMVEEKMASLCSESKTVLYATVSRIKRKFTAALGPWRAEAYIIKRGERGEYRTDAVTDG